MSTERTLNLDDCTIGDAMEALVEANAQIVSLKEELRLLADASAAYMEYHAAKFYDGLQAKPSGLWPAINRARAALARQAGLEGGGDA